MTLTVEMEEIVTSARSRPVLIVVGKIVAVRPYSRGSNTPGSEIELEGGSKVRVTASLDEVDRIMKGERAND